MRAYEKEPSTKTFGEPEVIELGIDHNGNRQWFMATREGFQEVGDIGGTLVLDMMHFAIGTRVTVEEPLPDPNDGFEDHDCGEDTCVCDPQDVS